MIQVFPSGTTNLADAFENSINLALSAIKLVFSEFCLTKLFNSEPNLLS